MEPLLAKHLWAMAVTRGGTAPCVPREGCGEQEHPVQIAENRASPGLCCVQGLGTKQIHLTGEAGEGIIKTLYEAERSKGKRCLSLKESWLESERAGDAPTTAQLRMEFVFPRVTQGRTSCGILAQQMRCWTRRRHTSEITGKIKTWKTTIKGELPGERNRMVCCLYEASGEVQQVRKKSLSGRSELHTFSYYTPDFCWWTHCYSIWEILAPAVLFPLCTKSQNLFHYFCKEMASFAKNYLYIKIKQGTEMFY